MPIKEAVTRSTSHSHSRMQAYASCPLSYKLEYIDKVGKDDSDALEIGAAAHEFFDRFVQGKKYAGVEGLAKSEFQAYVLSLSASCFQKEPRRQDNFKEYLEICTKFAEDYRPSPDYAISLSEQQIAVNQAWQKTGWFAPDTWFRAKLDRIDLPNAEDGPIKKIRIVDYKTGFSGSMDTFQLDNYALLGKILYPDLEEVEVQFYYVRSGFKQTKLLQVKDLDVTKVQIEALAAKIESDSVFKAKPGARCLNCVVAAFCTQKPSTLVAITNVEQAQDLAGQAAFLEAQLKAKKKAIKAWCEKNGKVESNGLTWDNFPTESLKVEMAPLLKLCVQYNIDPAEVLNTDSTSLKKWFKKDPAFADALSPFISVETGMRFQSKKSDKDE